MVSLRFARKSVSPGSTATGDHRDLVELSSGGCPFLDFGCADGDLAFFLESLGMKVLSFDHVRTNHNGMWAFAPSRKS